MTEKRRFGRAEAHSMRGLGDGLEGWRATALEAQARRCESLLAAGHAVAPSPSGCCVVCTVCAPPRAHVPMERAWPRCPACGTHHPGVPG